MLYLMLANRLDAKTALSAADGWGGGSLVQYRTAGRSCTRIDLRGRTSAEQSSMLDALTKWVASLPPGQAIAATKRGVVEVDACDPGRSARPGPRSLEDALQFADLRASNIDEALTAGFGTTVATCIGNQAVSDPPLLAAEGRENQGYGPPASSDERTINRELARLGRTCGVGAQAAAGVA
jgi:hypothetical protein